MFWLVCRNTWSKKWHPVNTIDRRLSPNIPNYYYLHYAHEYFQWFFKISRKFIQFFTMYFQESLATSWVLLACNYFQANINWNLSRFLWLHFQYFDTSKLLLILLFRNFSTDEIQTNCMWNKWLHQFVVNEICRELSRL